jgi:hypothetical protein
VMVAGVHRIPTLAYLRVAYCGSHGHEIKRSGMIKYADVRLGPCDRR